MSKLSPKEKEFLDLIRNGNTKEIEKYIERNKSEGYNILNNFPPCGNTPLGTAIHAARADVVFLLLERGSECETPISSAKLTPLQLTVLYFSSERKKEKQPEFNKIIELLLEYGADSTLRRDENDTSPLDLAKKHNLQSILPLLEEAAAKHGNAQQLEGRPIEKAGLRHRGDKKAEASSVTETTAAPAQEMAQSAPSSSEPGYSQGIINSVYSWFTGSDESSYSEGDSKPLLKSDKRHSF